MLDRKNDTKLDMQRTTDLKAKQSPSLADERSEFLCVARLSFVVRDSADLIHTLTT